MQPQASGTLSAGDAIGYGWAAFKRYAGPLLLIIVVIVALNIGVSVVGRIIGGSSTALAFVFQIVGWLISTLLAMGVIRASLKVTRGEEPEVSDLFVTDGFGPYLGASILFSIVAAIGFILFIIPGIFVVLIWGFFGFAIVDRGLGVGEAFSRSSEITKGQRGAIFVLGLAVLGINILGALLCGLGLLVSYPVSFMAFAYAYRVLSDEPVAPIPI